MKQKKKYIYIYHSLLFLIPAIRALRLQGHNIAEHLAVQIKRYYLDVFLFLLRIILFNQCIQIVNLKPFEILLKEMTSWIHFHRRKKSFYYKSYEILGAKPISAGSFSMEKKKAYSNPMNIYQSWNHKLLNPTVPVKCRRPPNYSILLILLISITLRPNLSLAFRYIQVIPMTSVGSLKIKDNVLVS